MSVAKQAIAARRKAQTDPRYSRQGRKDAIAASRKLRMKIENEKTMKMRKGTKR